MSGNVVSMKLIWIIKYFLSMKRVCAVGDLVHDKSLVYLSK